MNWISFLASLILPHAQAHPAGPSGFLEALGAEVLAQHQAGESVTVRTVVNDAVVTGAADVAAANPSNAVVDTGAAAVEDVAKGEPVAQAVEGAAGDLITHQGGSMAAQAEQAIAAGATQAEADAVTAAENALEPIANAQPPAGPSGIQEPTAGTGV